MKQDTSKIKYFLYARKSSESEDRQVQSIDDQINRLKLLARHEEAGADDFVLLLCSVANVAVFHLWACSFSVSVAEPVSYSTLLAVFQRKILRGGAIAASSEIA